MWGDNDELFATPSCDKIFGADARLQPLSDLLEHEVAGWMAFAVVDVLEVVNVEHQHSHRVRVARGTARVVVQLLIDVPAVVAPGQGVDAAQVVELRVALVQLVL